ncbi:MAG: amidohydrolase [Rhodospirillales bacterium]|jgi:predicted TIM-barrel fold metal-dependent hydrolase|nr:amidohydrolase [Rhodospirillales bacterium]
MRIVDAQVHIWGANSPERPWPSWGPGNEHLPQPFTQEKLLAAADAAGVDRVVIVPPSWEGDYNDLALAAAAAHPARFAVMGRFTIDPANGARLSTWRAQTGMLGLRFVYRPEMTWLYDDSAEWLWQACERHVLPVMMFAPGHLAALDRLAERHPGLNLVLDHMELRREKDAAAFVDLPDLIRIARLPNVAVKASALPCYTDDVYPYRSIHDYIRQVFDAFGPRRTFWGTDLTRLPCSYREAISFFTDELTFLSAEDKEWVMGRAVCEWLGWSLPT